MIYCRISSSVRKEAERLFSSDHVEQIIARLESSELPIRDNNPERVHLAILYPSRGEIHRFKRELEQARRDWRDTLVAAGLENENWQEVLRDRGIAISNDFRRKSK